MAWSKKKGPENAPHAGQSKVLGKKIQPAQKPGLVLRLIKKTGAKQRGEAEAEIFLPKPQGKQNKRQAKRRLFCADLALPCVGGINSPGLFCPCHLLILLLLEV